MGEQRDIIDIKQAGEPSPPPTAAEPETADEVSAIPEEELHTITADVVTALKTVYDPEIPVDIYELGLIYKVDLNDDRLLTVVMTLTAPGCPVAGEMPGWVEGAVRGVAGVEDVEVKMVFDPPWTPEKMSDEAKLELGWL
ncbi:MAG: SUF system Fe-S cluster assembly protein [Pseudomonadota bacterium]